MSRRTPWSPIFDVERSTGDIVVGATPGSPPPAAVYLYGVATAGSPNEWVDNGENSFAIASREAWTIGTVFSKPAALFDGTGSGASATADTSAVNGGICGFRLDSSAPADYQMLFNRDDGVGGAGRDWQFRISPTRNLEFVRVQGGVVTITSPGTVSLNTDYTAGWYWDGATVYIYIDGVSVASAAIGTLATDRPVFEIGWYPFSSGIYQFMGAIGEVYVFDDATSSTISDTHALIAA